MFFLFTNWNMFTIYQFSICSQTHPARSALSLSRILSGRKSQEKHFGHKYLRTSSQKRNKQTRIQDTSAELLCQKGSGQVRP